MGIFLTNSIAKPIHVQAIRPGLVYASNVSAIHNQETQTCPAGCRVVVAHVQIISLNPSKLFFLKCKLSLQQQNHPVHVLTNSMKEQVAS